MTKEMRPAHRVDILVHALVYYGMQKKEKLSKCIMVLCGSFFRSMIYLGQQLITRWYRAHKMKCVAEETLNVLKKSFKGNIAAC